LNRARVTIFSLFLITGCGQDSGFTDEDFEPKYADVQFVNLMADSDLIGVVLNDIEDIDGVPNLHEELSFRATTPLTPLPIPVDYQYSVFFESEQGEVEYISEEIALQLGDEDQLYYLYTGSIANPQETIVHFSDPELAAGPGEHQIEVWFTNSAGFEETFEVYLTSPSAPLDTSFPVAFVGPGQISPAVIISSRDTYRLRVRSDQSGLLAFDSAEFAIPEQSRNLFALIDHFGPPKYQQGQVDVHLITSSGSLSIADEDSPSELRTVNLLPDYDNIDVYFGSTSAEPLFSSLQFLEVSKYEPVENGDLSLNVTLPDVENEFLLQRNLTIKSGVYSNLFLAGSDESEFSTILTVVEPRSIHDRVSVTMINTGFENTPADFYLLQPGQSVEVAEPTGSLSLGEQMTVVIEPGVYEIVVTTNNDENEVFGPERLELAQDVTYSIVLAERNLLQGATAASVIVLRD
jgi:hypothetical protein